MIDVGLKPKLKSSQAQEIARLHYGLEVTAEELSGERDQNFRLQTSVGERWILKVVHPAEDSGVMDLQQIVLDRISATDPGLPCPRIVRTTSGQPLAKWLDGAGNEFLVRLVNYLPGLPLARVQAHQPELLREVGRVLAQVDLALANLWHPSARRSLQWSLYEASKIINRDLEAIQDPEQRSIVELFLVMYEGLVQPILGDLRSGLIHNDGNDYNILVTIGSEGRQRVSGLLDFGDMMWGPYVYEPAVAAAYALLDKEDPLKTAGYVIAGYHEFFPLQEDEIDLIFTLITMRLATSVTLAASQREREPGNDYLSISEQAAWTALRNLIPIDPQIASNYFRVVCGLPPVLNRRSQQELLARRRKFLGPSFSISYSEPLQITRGFRQYLYDARGRAYLDAVNNVPHVGHCHPRVVRAGQHQMALLNTNTRYLHDNLVTYAERICATLPEPLRVCYFVCSGSEANELALRLAKSYTGGSDFIVIDGAYHGNTNALIEISPYKFDGPGGKGKPEHVQIVPMPDTYRGRYLRDDPNAGVKYAESVLVAVEAIRRNGRDLAAFICESLPGCGGQIVLPPNYLTEAFRHTREAGGVCVVDEVQVGFGRVGSHFWGFMTQDVVPDIVTMGKPIGNGHPLAAVVTTHEIAESFTNGMEYFNTFGGNPVSCAIGLSVLDVIEEEELQENAWRVGEQMMADLRSLMTRHPLIGDVRGMGLFVGVELVNDREQKSPAAAEAAQIVDLMKEQGILISTDGPLHNVLKIKPPMVFTLTDAKRLVQTLDQILTRMGV